MRKKERVFIDDGQVKLEFNVSQMSATQLESFIVRCLLLMAKSGTDPQAVLDAMTKNNLAPVMTLLGSIGYDEVQPILNELLACCERVVPGGGFEQCQKTTLDGYVSSPLTIFKLYGHAARVNFSFLSVMGEEKASESPEPVNIGKPLTQKA